MGVHSIADDVVPSPAPAILPPGLFSPSSSLLQPKGISRYLAAKYLDQVSEYGTTRRASFQIARAAGLFFSSSRWPMSPPARDTTEKQRIASSGTPISSNKAPMAPVALIVRCLPIAAS